MTIILLTQTDVRTPPKCLNCGTETANFPGPLGNNCQKAVRTKLLEGRIPDTIDPQAAFAKGGFEAAALAKVNNIRRHRLLAWVNDPNSRDAAL